MDEMVTRLKALADDNRLKIVSLLLKHDYCVGAIAKRLNISEAAVSQHLKILREADIAHGEKKGYFTHYWINRELLKDMGTQMQIMADIIPKDSICITAKHECCKKEEREGK